MQCCLGELNERPLAIDDKLYLNEAVNEIKAERAPS